MPFTTNAKIYREGMLCELVDGGRPIFSFPVIDGRPGSYCKEVYRKLLHYCRFDLDLACLSAFERAALDIILDEKAYFTSLHEKHHREETVGDMVVDILKLGKNSPNKKVGWWADLILREINEQSIYRNTMHPKTEGYDHQRKLVEFIRFAQGKDKPSFDFWASLANNPYFVDLAVVELEKHHATLLKQDKEEAKKIIPHLLLAYHNDPTSEVIPLGGALLDFHYPNNKGVSFFQEHNAVVLRNYHETSFCAEYALLTFGKLIEAEQIRPLHSEKTQHPLMKQELVRLIEQHLKN